MARSGRVLVRDEVRHTRGVLRDVPRTCGSPVVGGRRLVMQCAPAQPPVWPVTPVARVWDLRTLRALPVADASSLATPTPTGFWVAPRYSFTGVGSRWLAVTVDDPHDIHAEFLFDWHDGHRIDDPSETRHTLQDLDAASGTERLCAPFARRRIEPDPEDADAPVRFAPVSFERPYLVVQSPDNLWLRRCGTRSRRLISRSHDGSPVTIAGGTVAWSDGTRLHALVIHGWRKRSWRLPENRDYTDPVITLTRRRIYAQAGYEKLWSGHLPGRLRRR